MSTVSKLMSSGFESLLTFGTIRALTSTTPQTAALTAAASTITHLALRTFSNSVTPRHQETFSEMIGRWTYRVPQVKEAVQKQVEGEYRKFLSEAKDLWSAFGKMHTALPEKGLSKQQLNEIVSRYSQVTNDHIKDKNISGAIYVPQDTAQEQADDTQSLTLEKGSPLEIALGNLNAVLPRAAEKAAHWNPLHKNEFPVGNLIEYQVVRIVADMFGGKANEVAGFVTSGGTESLMQAVYGYRQWGRSKGHGPTESVVIAPDTIHASIDKAGLKYDVKVVKVPADENGNVSLIEIKKAVKKYGSKVVALFGSAPNYPTGAVDPIKEMALIADEAGIGFHVDCCLGAFVIDQELDVKYLTYKGVTSLSADTHKNGLTAKGSSVLVGKTTVEQDIIYHSGFSIPEWRGGVYGTPRDPGSQSCVPAFQTLLTLLALGKQGYKENATNIRTTVKAIKTMLEQHFPSDIQVLGDARVNVIPFKIAESLNLEKGATYALIDELKKHNFNIKAIKGDAAHICVTGRFAQDVDVVRKLQQALKTSIDSVKELNNEVQAGKKDFPGDARLYCTVCDITEPNLTSSTWGKYFENRFLGPMALKATVLHYFKALQNPFVEVPTTDLTS